MSYFAQLLITSPTVFLESVHLACLLAWGEAKRHQPLSELLRWHNFRGCGNVCKSVQVASFGDEAKGDGLTFSTTEMHDYNSLPKCIIHILVGVHIIVLFICRNGEEDRRCGGTCALWWHRGISIKYKVGIGIVVAIRVILLCWGNSSGVNSPTTCQLGLWRPFYGHEVGHSLLESVVGQLQCRICGWLPGLILRIHRDWLISTSVFGAWGPSWVWLRGGDGDVGRLTICKSSGWEKRIWREKPVWRENRRTGDIRPPRNSHQNVVLLTRQANHAHRIEVLMVNRAIWNIYIFILQIPAEARLNQGERVRPRCNSKAGQILRLAPWFPIYRI